MLAIVLRRCWWQPLWAPQVQAAELFWPFWRFYNPGKIILCRWQWATACLSTIPLHYSHGAWGASGDFTALGLLAISFCIDSLLKAIDFHPAVCVCVGREGRKTENPRLEIYVASFPFSKQLKLGGLFPGHHRIQTSGIEAWKDSSLCDNRELATRLGRPRGPFSYTRWPSSRGCGVEGGALSRRATHKKESYLVRLSPHLFLHLLSSFMWRIKGIYGPEGVL